MRSKLPVVAFATLAVAVAVAAPGPERPVWSLVSITNGPDVPTALAGLDVDVEGGAADQLHVMARPADVAEMRARGLTVQVLAEDTQALRPAESDRARGPAYHAPDDATWSLRAIADTYPEIARTLDVGRSWEGRELTALLLTDQPWTREEDEPSLRLLGGHHGDEWSSNEVSLDLSWSLAERYAAGDAAIVDLIDHNEIWIVPIVNPDGVVAFTRRNSRNVDLNRNYAYQWDDGSAAGDHPFSEVETAAIRALSIARSFHHSLTLHSGATNLGWVWNFTTDDTPDEAWMEDICTAYDERTTQGGFWVTNGADWYITHGDTNDWSYGVRGGHDYTLEVTLDKAPPPEQIPEFQGYHTGPSIDFLVDGATAGVRGRVTDPEGRGLEAWVVVDQAPWPSHSDPETGAYARALLPGDVTFTVGSPGFAEVTSTATVVDGAPASVDVVLEPLGAADVDELFDAEVPAGGGEVTVCGPAAEGLGAGDVRLVRGGWTGEVELPFETKDGCVIADVDPGSLPLEPWQQSGEWTLLLGDDEPAALPLAVLIADDDLSGIPVKAEVDLLDGTAYRLDVLGVDLPRGALIRLRGPQGQRAWPVERLTDDEPGRISAVIDAADLADGTWSLRFFGRGEHSYLADILDVDGEDITAYDPEPPTDPTPDDDDDDATDDDDDVVLDDDDTAATDDDDDAVVDTDPQLVGTGCTCAASYRAGPSAGLALALLLLPLYSRRPRRAHRT